jgi:hypothetical protein
MTLRDYFAGQALMALGSMPRIGLDVEVAVATAEFASIAYAMADAMLTERAK